MKKPTRKITNTSEEARGPYGMMLVGAVMAGEKMSEIARDAEKRGQREIVESSQLPTKGLEGQGRDSTKISVKQMLVDNGGRILGKSPLDSLFTDVELPKGWKIEATSHSMWNDLKDAKGLKRASIFYKAAFYDRDAFIDISTRVYIGSEQDKEAGHDMWRVCVKDSNHKVLWKSPAGKYGDETLKTLARSTLAAKYPDWENPAAYWDVEVSFDS